MDIRTATQMEKTRRNAIAISTLLVVLMLGLTTTFVAMSFVQHNRGVVVDEPEEEVVNAPVNQPVVAHWVMPVSVAEVTVLKSADFDMLQYNQTTKWYEYDLGYTLGAEAGTKVVACFDGEVTSVIESGDASTGKLVRIKHTNGVETVYSSLDTITVAVGDQVKSGDQIGTVGNTANYETFDMPHVRLMFYQNGKPINPENFVEFPGNENK